MDYPGNLFVVSAPSGAGKSTLVKALLSTDSGMRPSVSHTTRAPRGREQHGKEYFFIDEAAFDAMVNHGDFLEWAQVHGKRYGTSRQSIQAGIAAGDDVVLEIDWQGALQVREHYANAVLVFILPPNLQELRARLLRRGEDSRETIEIRIHNAREEVSKAHQFDFVIINDSVERALSDLRVVVHAQRLKYASQVRYRAEIFRALNLT